MEMAFHSYLKNSIERRQPLSVIMIDIDFFKSYNDTYGHQQGDIALLTLSNAAKSVVRSKRDIACRFGGEECLVLLPNATEDNAVECAERIKQASDDLKLEHKNNSVSPYVTISMGVYSGIPKDDSASEKKRFIESADKALYIAKTSGRNRIVVFDKTMMK